MQDSDNDDNDGENVSEILAIIVLTAQLILIPFLLVTSLYRIHLAKVTIIGVRIRMA